MQKTVDDLGILMLRSVSVEQNIIDQAKERCKPLVDGKYIIGSSDTNEKPLWLDDNLLFMGMEGKNTMVLGNTPIKDLTKFNILYTYYFSPLSPLREEVLVVTPLPSYVNPREVYLKLENEQDYNFLDKHLHVVDLWEKMNIIFPVGYVRKMRMAKETKLMPLSVKQFEITIRPQNYETF